MVGGTGWVGCFVVGLLAPCNKLPGDSLRLFVKSAVGSVCGAVLAAGLGVVVPSGAAAASGLVAADEVVEGLSGDVGSLRDLEALPSQPPAAGFGDGGGGLVSESWPVWGLPGARGGDDPGIGEDVLPVAFVKSLRPRFTALAGQGSYRFTVLDVAGKDVVWDSGEVTSSTDGCVITDGEASCTMVDQVLRNGETYRLRSVAGGVTKDRLFAVRVEPGIGGANGVVTLGQMYETPAGGLVQIGLAFSSGEQGAVAASDSDSGGAGLARAGLPAGWQWSGPVAGFMEIERVRDSVEYSGYRDLLLVRSDSGSQTLGCVEQSGSELLSCASLVGGVFGGGSLTAEVYPDGSVVVATQGSGQNWTFDSQGRLVAAGATGLASIEFAHREVAGVDGSVLSQIAVPDLGWQWDFQYAGDAGCETAELPAGFVAAPSGYACGWTEPDGKRSSIFYTQPDGASVPRISRVVHAPADCALVECDVAELGVFDLGWDEFNRLAFHRQDGVVEAMLIGNLDPGDEQVWGRFTYDDLGRLASTEQGVLKPGGRGGAEVGRVTTSYSYEAAPQEFQPAFRQLVTTTSGPGAPDFSTVQAVDAAGRLQFKVADDGVIDQYVWDADKPLQYGAVVGGLSVSGTQYDKDYRPVREVAGPLAAFDLERCAANAPDRGNASCQLVDGAPLDSVTARELSYDDPASVGTGLRGQWYPNTKLTGHPVAATQLHSGTGSEAGFVIDPPPAVGDQWSLSLTGALVLDTKATWNVTVEVPDGMFTQATLLVDGQVCLVMPKGGTSAACTVASDGDARVPMELAMAHDPNGQGTGRVVVSVQPGPFDPPTTDDEHFLQLAGATTAATGIDHDPDGTPVRATHKYSYEDPNTDLPTATTQVATEDTNGPQTRVTRSAYERTEYGGNRPTVFTNESGSQSTQHYWGLHDTPKSVGLANLDQIPTEYQDVPQLGQVQYTESSGGNQQWGIYDHKGVQVCEAITQTGHDPQWSCQERDPRGRLLKATARGQDGQADIVTEYTYLFDPEPGQSPFITQSTRTEAGKPTLTTLTREWASGIFDLYIDAQGSTTQHFYDATGAITETRTTINPNQARPQTVNTQGSASLVNTSEPVTIVRKTSYDELLRPKTLSNDTQVLAEIHYDNDDPRKIVGYDYLDGKASLDIQFDQYGYDNGITWHLPDADIAATWTRTAAGQLLSEQFHDLTNTYHYDGWGRLTQAVTSHNGVDNHFLYSWDINSQRTCAAHETNNHAQGHCDQANTATTFTYNNDRLIASSSPATRIPNDPFTNDGSYKKIGDQSYQYDAARQLTTAQSEPNTNHTTATVDYLRDADNRILTQTTTGNNAGAYTNIYPQPGFDAGPIAVVTATGEVLTTQSLPGGLVQQGDDKLIITAAGGLATLTLDANANLGDNQVEPWGPYGEPITPQTDTPNQPKVGWHGQNSNFDATLLNLGARPYRSDLAMFLRPDPIPGGSGTANEYAYVSGDPINSTDLTGTSTQWHVALFGSMFSLITSAIAFWGVAKLVNAIPLGVTGTMRQVIRAGLQLTVQATASVGFSIALQTGIQGGFNMDLWQWLATGITAAIAGITAMAVTARSSHLAKVKRVQAAARVRHDARFAAHRRYEQRLEFEANQAELAQQKRTLDNMKKRVRELREEAAAAPPSPPARPKTPNTRGHNQRFAEDSAIVQREGPCGPICKERGFSAFEPGGRKRFSSNLWDAFSGQGKR